MQRITTFSIALLLLSISSLLSAQDPDPRPCFFPNGSRAPGYVACNTAATGHSACCRNNNQTTCFSTGLCYLDRGFYERGACTDQSWQSDSCPGPCRDFRNSGQNILACADTTGSFCCGTGSNPSCCSNRDNYFTFEVGQIAFINGEPVSRTRTAGPAMATGTSTNPATATTEPQIIERTQTGVIAGMAAGIGVASVIAIAFAIMYFRERKKLRKAGAAGVKYESSGNGGNGRVYDEQDHYGRHDAGEREGFMSPRGAWAPGGSGGADSPRMAAVIPPKYVPPERRGESTVLPQPPQPPQPPQQPLQTVDGGQLQGTPLGELPGQGNSIEGLSELAGTESTRRY
ncbi:hypothetical protein TWF569_009843 [Orbilia oligospora]|uniref:Mid2 domain-containing protein n=1 Tax=Orbilia oligospora TaxID=2813651 RepID=A0A7C8JD95_ORBOL|nr:hypothetical protein TWF706_006650 [Orbilia oligospora]KAF3112698.1 hypothetical protein TWF102_004097 [Orbilia oligospora]KAF3117624.1 hypothetical protein TWF103_004309 [Orbilia oligospora]KAF3142856.1 hypothetical protein TWF703_000360 [Orbilia oligospora]KAF3152086.1 hypothetical protein TWF594_005838 [Orbilia oligospora]